MLVQCFLKGGEDRTAKGSVTEGNLLCFGGVEMGCCIGGVDVVDWCVRKAWRWCERYVPEASDRGPVSSKDAFVVVVDVDCGGGEGGRAATIT